MVQLFQLGRVPGGGLGDGGQFCCTIFFDEHGKEYKFYRRVYWEIGSWVNRGAILPGHHRRSPIQPS